jgi:dolichol-phosphate mannosyltransferase
MPSVENKVTALSVAAPAYNEAADIAAVISAWLEYLKNLPGLSAFEVVICNDGSSDTTASILDGLALVNPALKVVHHKINQGAAQALVTAIRNTQYHWVLLIDSDGQYGIENLEQLIGKVENTGVDAVMGVRILKSDSLFARFGSSASGWLCNLFHGTHYRDFNCALKLVKGDLLRSLTLEAKGLNYSGETTSKLIEQGVKIGEVEVVHKPRSSGRSSAQNIRAAWHRLLFVLYMGFRQFLLRNKVIQSRLFLD